ncbi:MAG: hypothetical protein WD045_00955 [Pirellulaceae bacterium]
MPYALHNPAHRHRCGRSNALAGITLIEVMMSAMVVSLGIMGLVALIPLGTHLTERGTRADRVASLGQRAYHEAKIRGYLNPVSWVSPGGGGLDDFVRPHATPSGLPVRQPYLIDPWFFPDDSTEGNRRFFPASLVYAIDGDNVGGTTPPTRMHRLSLLSAPNSGTRMPRRQAAVNFMSQDDLSSERPSNGDRPPFQTFFTRGDNVPVRRQAQGDYTWMLMLVPELRSITPLNPPAAGLNALSPPIDYTNTGIADVMVRDNVRRVLQNNATDEYNLSVIVMQQRQPRIPLAGDFGATQTTGADPSERVLEVNPASFANTGGYSTGEVQLQINTSGSLETDEAMLRLSNGDWICLARRVAVAGYPAGDVYQWCRVSSVSEIIDPGTATPSIFVTFTGPDWSSVAGNNRPTHAIIVEGVVGVYTKRVRLDLSTY